MADEIDIAEQKQAALLEATIANIQKKSAVNIYGDGICIECGSEVDPIMLNGKPVIGRFCSTICRDIWGK